MTYTATTTTKPEIFRFSDCPTLSDYILRYQQDGILWLAGQLLGEVDNPIVRNDRTIQLAGVLAKLPPSRQVVKDDYVTRIAKDYGLNKKTFEKLVSEAGEIEGRKSKMNATVRKNTPVQLNGNAKTFPFFSEIINTKTDTLKAIKIDKVKFVQLLASFGFTRYSNGDEAEGYAFVRIMDNLIKEVSAEEMKDFMEDFVRKEYDFQGAGCEHTDADTLLNTFYDSLGRFFSRDLFARVRVDQPIIINRDKQNEAFIYFQNGFVRITKEDYSLIPYDKMEGSVWAKQMLPRTFEVQPIKTAGTEVHGEFVPDWEQTFLPDPEGLQRPLGDFADFVWRISGQRSQRFVALCSILGYLVHDFYDYKLKAILFTDSTISDASEGRTGKTLLGRMLGFVRSYTEINGKDFEAGNKNKYEDVNRSTQIVHLNDVRNKGRNRFDFEDVFNDVTEGFMVNAKFKTPFRHIAKIIISSNRTLPIEGDSQRDRIIEFEMSNFFSASRSPEQFYGHWFGRDWDASEWNRFDNFICFCVQVFLVHGVVSPDAINLKERKLRDQTSPEFLDFMEDIISSLAESGLPWAGWDRVSAGSSIFDIEFDKNILFQRFLTTYPDFKNTLYIRRFTAWLKVWGETRLQAAIAERRSNGAVLFKYIDSSKNQ